MTNLLRSRPAGALLTAAIVGLTLGTAYIHLTLGGTSSFLGILFLLNAAGFAGLAMLMVVAAAVPAPIVHRFSWLPRLALAGFTAMTIAGYLVMGPYFTLGWITKGIEVGIIALLVIDMVRVFGSPVGMVRTALASVAPVLPSRFRPEAG
ncbi:MAG: hypothetical protein ACRDGV_02935 [Candidatus Limnocylindria bacterium]